MFLLLRKVSYVESENLAKKENIKYFEISAKTGNGISRMLYSAISDLSFFEQFDVEKNVIINELEFDYNKTNNIDNSSINLGKNLSSSRNINFINVKDNKGKIKDRLSNDQSKKNNCNC